ncbi:MAG: hypothetical protein ACI4NM_07805 [Bullifex sp.]
MAEYYTNDPDNGKRRGDEGTMPLILGILSIVLSLTFSRLIGLILGIIAIVKGSQHRYEDNDAKAGFICGIIGVCLSSAFLLAIFAFMFSFLFVWIV